MNLGHIERGDNLKIFEELDNCAISEEYEAVFRYYETGKLFTVHCPELYNSYNSLNPDAHLNISVFTQTNIHMFNGQAVEKQRSSGIVLIEQLTDIVTINRRRDERDEIRVRVRVYGLSEAQIKAPKMVYPDVDAEMSDMTYDISAGGVCIIANTLLSSKHDPHYLIEFSIGANDKESFLLPAKLVRRSNFPRTKIGRYDYGFQFLFDNLPNERGRLSRAILNKKLSFR